MLRGGLFSVTLSVEGSFHSPPPVYSTRYAAVWCPDFPLEKPAVVHRHNLISKSLGEIKQEAEMKNSGASSLDSESQILS